MSVNILFVDDEPDVLEGLRRSMRRNRDRFELRFANSGALALELLEEKPADIVISDMRMPGMDGAELLLEVQRRFPAAIRMILSGYADPETVLRTAGPAHQYMSKPCDADTLCKSIDRALALRVLIDSPSLRSSITGLQRLSTLPDSVTRLINELESANQHIDTVVDIISRDIAMTAHIMKLANSSFFTVSNSIRSPRQAVQMLGFDTIKALIYATGIFSMVPRNATSTAILHRLNERSLSIGILAKAIANLEGLDEITVRQTSCAGVLSHVGTLVLLNEDLERFTEATALADRGEADIATAEKGIFSTSHAELGAYLLGLWGFSDPVVEAVAYHHNPSCCACSTFNPLAAIHVAQNFSKALDYGVEVLPELEARLDMAFLEKVGAAHRLPVWLEFLKKQIANKRQR